MANTMTSVNLPAPVLKSFCYKMLAIETPDFIFGAAATERNMPANGGQYIGFRRYQNLPAALSPLGPSGNPIPATEQGIVDIQAKIQFYGQFIRVTDQVVLQNQDPVLNEMTATLGLALRKTEDTITRDMLVTSASSIFAVGGNNGDSPTNISRADTERVNRILRTNNAKRILANQRGEDRFATSPVRQAYLAMGHTNLSPDLNAMNGFLNQYNYPNPNMGMDAEEGAVGNIRFLLSSNGSITPNASNRGADVYNIPITGLEAYSRIYQDNFPASFIFKPPMFSDELNQTSTIGWRTAFANAILNDKWVQVLKVTLA